MPPHRIEPAHLALEFEGRGVVAHFLVELLEVVLGLLDSAHQAQVLLPPKIWHNSSLGRRL